MRNTLIIQFLLFFVVITFFCSSIFFFNSKVFLQITTDNRSKHSEYLKTKIDQLDKISSNQDFKKKINNDEFFKNAFKQKNYWELLK